MFNEDKLNKSYSGVSDEIRQQRGKMKDMPLKEKFAYFWYYYKVHTFAVLFVAIFAIALIHDMKSQKDYGFYALMLNSSFLNSESIENTFSSYAPIDTEAYECEVDTLTTLSLQNGGQYDYSTLQKLIAQLQVGDFDAMILDGEIFYRFSLNSMLTDLREVFTAEELAAYEGSIYYVDGADIELADQSESDDEAAAAIYDKLNGKTTEEINQETELHRDPSAMTDPIPVGIFVEDTRMISDTGCYPGLVPVYGIAVTSKHIDEAKQYLTFMDDPQIDFAGMITQY